MPDPISMSSPDMTDAERDAVQQVLKTPILSMGHWATDFERSFTKFTGRNHAIRGFVRHGWPALVCARRWHLRR